MNSSDESPAVVELPDDEVQAARVAYDRLWNEGAQESSCLEAALLAAYPLIAAHVVSECLAAVRSLPRRSGQPEWSKGHTVAQGVGYDVGLAAAQDAIHSVEPTADGAAIMSARSSG